MFQSIANVVTRRGALILAAWLALAVTLVAGAPSWDRVTRDDDVRFFPAGFPSVVGQELLERGFPQDAASSQVVVVAERALAPSRDQVRIVPTRFGDASGMIGAAILAMDLVA